MVVQMRTARPRTQSELCVSGQSQWHKGGPDSNPSLTSSPFESKQQTSAIHGHSIAMTQSEYLVADELQRDPHIAQNSGDIEIARLIESTSEPNFEGPGSADKQASRDGMTSDARYTIYVFILPTNFLSAYGCVMVAPGIPRISQSLASTYPSDGITLVSFYALGGVIGPLMSKPLSAVYGRLIIHHVSIAMFLASNIACAVVQDLPALILLRVLAGCASGSLVWNSQSVIIDTSSPKIRRLALSTHLAAGASGIIFGSALGALVQNWRWNFIMISIIVGLDPTVP